MDLGPTNEEQRGNAAVMIAQPVIWFEVVADTPDP